MTKLQNKQLVWRGSSNIIMQYKIG